MNKFDWLNIYNKLYNSDILFGMKIVSAKEVIHPETQRYACSKTLKHKHDQYVKYTLFNTGIIYQVKRNLPLYILGVDNLPLMFSLTFT